MNNKRVSGFAWTKYGAISDHFFTDGTFLLILKSLYLIHQITPITHYPLPITDFYITEGHYFKIISV